MQKIDWVSKLTSRKFWVAVAGLVSGLIIFFGGAEGTATQVTALIMSAASVVAYVLGEGLIDAAHVDGPPIEFFEDEENEDIEE